jgi:hypothetical protein
MLTCGANGPLWHVEVEDPSAAGLSAVQLLVERAAAATIPFTMLATVGPPGTTEARYYALRVSGAPTDSGTGTVAITEDRDAVTLTVDGRTESGTTLRLTVVCHAPLRFPLSSPIG